MAEKASVIPELCRKDQYPLWKKKVEAYRILSTAEKKKQALNLAIRIKNDTISQALFNKMTVTEMNQDDGVAKLLKTLDDICLSNTIEGVFTAIENLETYKRKNGSTIIEYLEEFDRRKTIIEEFMPIDANGVKKDCTDSILAFRMMKQALLPEHEEHMVRAYVKDLSSKEMTDVLKRIYGERIVDVNSSKIKLEPQIKSEVYHNECDDSDNEENCMYNNYYRQNKFKKNRNGASGSGNYFNKNNNNSYQNNKFKRRCFNCQSEDHLIKDCPKNKTNMTDKRKQICLTSDIFEEQVITDEGVDDIFTISETMNKALIDTGASATVCGKSWLKCYEDSLTPEEMSEIKEIETCKKFRFGDGRLIKAEKHLQIPVRVCNEEFMLNTHVVDCDIPLLLSRDAMKKMNCKIDAGNDQIIIGDVCQNLFISESGHMLVSIGRCESNIRNDENENITVLLSNVEKMKDPRKCAEHWHRYFAHASANKIGEVLMKSNLERTFREEVLKDLNSIDKSCSFCLKHKKQTPHKKVALKTGRNFNDIVAMDLKFIDADIVLHIIDTLTRYSIATKVNSKKAAEILTHIMKCWIAIFGKPNEFISDNGGEFINDEFTSMCEHLNIKINTSPAESPWCNGLVERHNAIIGGMVQKIMSDINCDIHIALAWAVNAKNTLNNVYGYSSHFLVFGINPKIPDLLSAEELPALNNVTSSEIVANHLNALCEARKAFVELQNSDRLKRSLKERIYPSATARFCPGDKVYIKRNQSNDWSGPAEVVGQKENQVLVWNAGRVIKLHPVKVVRIEEAKEKLKNCDLSKINVNLNDDCVSPQEGESHENEDEYYYENHSQEEEKDSQEEGNSKEGNHSQEIVNNQTETWTTISNFSSGGTKVQLNQGDIVRFRNDINSDWQRGKVSDQAGRNGAATQNTFNIELNDDTRRINCNNVNIEKLDHINYENDVLCSDLYIVNEDSDQLIAAKNVELQRFKDFDVYEEVKYSGQPIITSRWVITQKKNKTKARLVARGYEDMNAPVADAPTAAKTSLRILFLLSASFSWQIDSIDITAAFLQSESIRRNVYIKPPKDIATPGIVWLLKKPMYGLDDSSRNWYFTLKKAIIELGCVMSILDKCVFIYTDNKKLEGLIISHVDDLLFSGTAKFKKNIIQQLKKTFIISREHTGSFVYLGWNVKQCENAIEVDQRTYSDSVKPIKVDNVRKQETEDSLRTEEKTQYQQLLGQLLWLSGQTRPDLVYDTLEHSTFTKNPKVKNLLSLNKVVKRMSDGPKCIRFNKMNFKDKELRLICYTDASLGNLPNRVDTARGYIIYLVDETGIGSVLCWSSNKIRRVVHSAFGAETLGFLDGIAAAIYLRSILCEILFQDVKSNVIPIIAVTDSNQLVQNVKSTKQCSDHKLRLYISEIQESIEKDGIIMKWTSTKDQLADCLTKKTANSYRMCQTCEFGSLTDCVF